MGQGLGLPARPHAGGPTQHTAPKTQHSALAGQAQHGGRESRELRRAVCACTGLGHGEEA